MSAACQHDHDGAPPTQAVIDRAMAEADALCRADGERMTDARQRVLELLLGAGEPVKAYDLIARFGRDGQAAKPPTVYRALDFLERRGLVHRIASISAYVACTAGHRAHAAAFLICDCCGATREVSPLPDDAFTAAADRSGYAIERVVLEGHGLCPSCREA